MSAIFTFSSISSGLLFWSVNQISMNENSALVAFNTVCEWGN